MTLFKKYAWYGSAVVASLALALVMLVSSTARIAEAAATITPGTWFVDDGTNLANGGSAYSVLPNPAALTLGTQVAAGGGFKGSAWTSTDNAAPTTGTLGAAVTPTDPKLVFAGGAAGAAVGTTIIFTAPTGWQFQDTGAVPTTGGTVAAGVGVLNATNTAITWTITVAPGAVTDSLTFPSLEVRPAISTTAGGAITLGGTAADATAGATVGTITATTRSTVGTIYGFALTPSIDSGGSNVTFIETIIVDGNQYAYGNTIVNYSAGIGCFGDSTCTATAVNTTNANTGEVHSTKYKGKGTTGTDTVVTTAPGLTGVTPASSQVVLNAASGTTAAKTVIIGTSNDGTIASNVNNVTGANYSSPLNGADVTVAAQDGTGAGVNGQILLVTVSKGAVVAGETGIAATDRPNDATGAGLNAVCATASATTVTVTTGTIGTNTGYAKVTFCAPNNPTGGTGAVTMTVTNISTSGIAAATTNVSTAGIPATINATVTGQNVTASVTDANGTPVADGTVVRFNIAPNSGVASVSCTTTQAGKASSGIALTGTTGQVLISAEWNATGAALSYVVCSGAVPPQTNAGSQSISATTTVGAAPSTALPPAGTGTTTPPAAGTGAFAATPVFSSSKLANAVFTGTLSDTLLTGVGATGAWAQDSKGNFTLDVVGAPSFVNAAFLAAFPGEMFPTATALTLVGK